MPWSNNSGGGWQGGGSGSNGSGGGGGGGPWGQPPRGNGPRGPQRPGGGGGNQPPDLEEILRKSQDRLRNVFPGNRPGSSGPSLSAPLIALIALGLAVFYVFTSAYQVEADEIGIELLFGKPQDTVGPGLHFAFWPVETVEKVQIVERKIQVGSSGSRNSTQGLMLSGDQNIVNVSFAVLYNVDDPAKFLFAVREPELLVEEVAESAMREIVGRRPAQDVFRDARSEIELQVREIVERTLADYNTGIAVRGITIEDAAPPSEVADAFDEVQRAEQDEDRFQEEANRERNRVLGGARGEAAQIREEAAAYKSRVVEEAKGEAARFTSVYEQYRRAPEVTRKRLFLETMEEVLADSNKIILEQGQGGGQGVVPYLPLPEVQNRSRGNGNVATSNGNQSGAQSNTQTGN